MSLNREEKAAVVAEVSAQVATAQAIIVAEYRGLEVGAITGLRKQARESGVYLRVLKNTLARRAKMGRNPDPWALGMCPIGAYMCHRDRLSWSRTRPDEPYETSKNQ